MSRKQDIEALLERAIKSLPRINAEYEKALHAKTIGTDLKIDIKDYFGNLRSVLDYLARDIVEKYCPTVNPKDNLYFPIRQDQVSFDNEMKKSYPDLDIHNKFIYDILKSEQPFQSSENKWLLYFNKLNNENKHERLVSQKRTETIWRVKVEFNDGGGVFWDPSRTKFGSGVFIGDAYVNPKTQMPETSDAQKTIVETWVDFRFDGIDVSGIWLIQESLKQIQKIYTSVKNII